MFRLKSARLRNKTAGRPGNETYTLIGPGTIMDGKLISQSNLRIEGQFIGEIECAGDLTVGENSVLESDISARNVINAGTINGTVRTKEVLKITETGKVFGQISVNALSIVKGGVLHGTSRMNVQCLKESRKEQTGDDDIPSNLTKIEKLSKSK
ncbi:bactofilin family protein [Ferviditalea candida]|uniref:Polymer-forming cytoskeletal protein n=1 Tax=Ferviditalea candida TaxID=3108399 RepID=A0ABU5ZEH4_9BACL|nr:polymer-forming cytoskeletal protein [Paenibacillaceae bacterium T2]